MNIKEVTDEWVQQNFNIDEERNEVCRESECCVCSLDIADEACSTEEMIQRFASSINALLEPEARFSKCHIECGWDDPSSFCVVNYHFRPETDKEVIARIKRREKSQIKSQERKRQKQEKEYEKYIRLKKKFEGDE